MGIGKHMHTFARALLAVVLAVGLMPASAFAVSPSGFDEGIGTDASGNHQMSQEAAISGDTTSSNVFVEVAIDDFKLTDRSPNVVVADAAAALAFYKTSDEVDAPSAIWAQTTGGTTPITATWKVTHDGTSVGTFIPTQEADGTWPLPLTQDGANGSLKVADPGLYDCTFTATDAQGRVVTCRVTFLIEQNSPYGAKTVYKDASETFDGISTYTEPSATGIIHKFVQRLSATEGKPLSAVYTTFMEMAAAYAKEKNQEGAYALDAVWSTALKFTHDQADPATTTYKGDLQVVIPITGAVDVAPAIGSTVTVFAFDGTGNKTPFEATVEADDTGNKYVTFYDATLGSYAVAHYVAPGGGSGTGPGGGDDDDDPTVRVTATVEGSGFVNYPGTYTWPKTGAIRYLFTPVTPGNVLDKVEVLADGKPLEVPAWVTTAGYYDLDLGALDKSVKEVTIKATFKSTGGSGGTDPDNPNPPVDPDNPNPPVDPDDPDNPASKQYTLKVTKSGEGEVAVAIDGKEIASAPYKFKQNQAINLICTPTGTSQSVESATLVVDGQEIPLAVRDGAVSFAGPASDAEVRIVFSSEDVPPLPAHTVTVIVDGGHGSIDAPYTSEPEATREAQKALTPSAPATFTLFPEDGYRLYTVTEDGVELGAYLTSVGDAYGLSVPDIGRNREIHVSFTKAEELPPVVPEGTFATIDVKCEATGGLDASDLPSATPSEVSVPKGAGYSFYIIPAASGNAELAYVRAKSDDELTWRDITTQATWVTWPQGGAAGYWELKVSGVTSDTHVRVGFRGLEDTETPKPPAKTRNITINVVGSEWGAVFPNTVGKPPLKVPVGKSIVVTVVTKDGYHYEVKRADDARSTQAQADVSADAVTNADTATSTATDIALVAPTSDASGTEGDSTSTEVIGGTGDEDEEWTFVFGPNGSGDNPSSSSSGTSSGGSSGGSSGSSSGGSSSGNQGGTGSDDGTGSGSEQGRYLKVTPIVVADANGNTHGRISPSEPIYVERGKSTSFAFTRDVGYKVDYVEVNGERVTGHTNSGYTLQNVQRDTEVRVAFKAQAETDAMTPVDRTVHRLQSLAKTGDLTPPAITLLLCVAFAAGGLVILMSARRRKEEPEAVYATETMTLVEEDEPSND